MSAPLRWEVDGLRFQRRPSDPGPYTVLRADLTHPKVGVLHHVELTASPSGKNLHVYVDGERYVREADR